MAETKKLLYNQKEPPRERITEETLEVLRKHSSGQVVVALKLINEPQQVNMRQIVEAITGDGILLSVIDHTLKPSAFIFWRQIEWITFEDPKALQPQPMAAPNMRYDRDVIPISDYERERRERLALVQAQQRVNPEPMPRPRRTTDEEIDPF